MSNTGAALATDLRVRWVKAEEAARGRPFDDPEPVHEASDPAWLGRVAEGFRGWLTTAAQPRA